MFAFAPAPDFRTGAIYLGREGFREVGIKTERHACAVAGTGMGKTSTLVIPNLLRWPDSVVCIDPKGTSVLKTVVARLKMGQQVVVLDPFGECDIPDELRGSFNPLARIEPDGFTAREEIQVIADGMVKIHDPKHMEWIEGARAIIAGVAAFVVDTATPETRNLVSVRSILLRPDEELYAIAQDMMDCRACGGLARAAGVTIMTALDSTKGMERDFLGGARRGTTWLDSEPIAHTLTNSSFDLAALKTGKVSLFLVLPPLYLETHAPYLRLFTRAALYAMAAGGSDTGGQCLFILDEFANLGRLDDIGTYLSLGRSYGIRLFCLVQQLSQLTDLYGINGAEGFFANSDAHIFFGNTDPLTLAHISARLGKHSADEMRGARPFPIAAPMPMMPNISNNPETAYIQHDIQVQQWEFRREEEMRAYHEQAAYDAEARKVGQERFPPDLVKEIVGRGDDDDIARAMIVFGKGRNVHRITLHPYFKPMPPDPRPAQLAAEAKAQAKEREAAEAKKWQEVRAERARERVQNIKLCLQVAAAAFVVALLMVHYGQGWIWWLGFVFSMGGGILLAVAQMQFEEHRRISKLA